MENLAKNLRDPLINFELYIPPDLQFLKWIVTRPFCFAGQSNDGEKCKVIKNSFINIFKSKTKVSVLNLLKVPKSGQLFPINWTKTSSRYSLQEWYILIMKGFP